MTYLETFKKEGWFPIECIKVKLKNNRDGLLYAGVHIGMLSYIVIHEQIHVHDWPSHALKYIGINY